MKIEQKNTTKTEKIEIKPLEGQINVKTSIPGSKSYTNRALAMAALSKGKTTITGYSPSKDSELLENALKQVGIKIERTEDKIVVEGNGGDFSHLAKSEEPIKIDMGAAGTSTRFFTSIAALIPTTVIVDGSERMRERPIKDLVEALRSLGVEIEYMMKDGCPPLKIKGGNISNNKVRMRGDKSSQYFTSLLQIAPVLANGLEIEVEGEQVSKSYIDMTIGALKSFGVTAQNQDYKKYIVPAEEIYTATNYHVEGDASGCSYLWGIAALSESTIEVKNISKKSSQGDVRFPELLEMMGCEVKYNDNSISVTGSEHLKAIEVDMELMPDTAQTLSVIAAFAEGDTKITGLQTLRIKETDRLEAVHNELAKMGVETEIGDDYIIIHGKGGDIEEATSQINGAEIDTYKDHRMAMSFALAGVKIPGIVIKNPPVVKKSFPNFWDKLKSIGIALERK